MNCGCNGERASTTRKTTVTPPTQIGSIEKFRYKNRGPPSFFAEPVLRTAASFCYKPSAFLDFSSHMSSAGSRVTGGSIMRMFYWPLRFVAAHAVVACAITTYVNAQDSQYTPLWEPDQTPTLNEALSGASGEGRDSVEVSVLSRVRTGDDVNIDHGVRTAAYEEDARIARREASRRSVPWSPTRSEPPTRRPPWRGTLLPNPDRGNGHPPYIVVDRYGMKRRYIRPTSDVNLERHLYQAVIVRRDTGLMLSATHLDLLGCGVDDYADRRQREPNIHNRGYDREHDRVYDFDREHVPLADRRDYDAYADQVQFAEELPLGNLLEPPTVELLPSDGEPLVLDDWASGLDAGPGDCPTCHRRSGPFGLGLLDIGRGGFGLFRPDVGELQNEHFGACDVVCETSSGDCTGLPLFWGRAEYLIWWPEGMRLPPLVTSSPNGTAQALAGVLPGASILFGNSDVLEGHHDGARFRGGFRILPRLGIEADYYALDDEWIRYQATGTAGAPILGRPFFNMLTAAEDAELVSFPGLVEGTVTVDANTDLESHGVALRYGLFCEKIGCGDRQAGGVSRIDILGGYRYMQLDEGLRIREDLTSLNAQNPGTSIVQDSFRTHNDFNGGELGAVWQWEDMRWSLELLAKLAIGATRQEVTIAGNTVLSENGFTQSLPGGLLAQRSNIGRYARKEFTMIPELGATLGFRVTKRLRLTAGYTLVYWSSVVRPGDHVDLDLNPNLFPPEVIPFVGPLRPTFAWNATDFLAHGMNAGVDYRW